MLNIITLVSGHGSNLQAIIDKAETIGIKIQAVISDNRSAYALERAKKANIKTHVILQKNDALFAKTLQKTISHYAVDLIVLAGFMRILSADFVSCFHNQIINIHPSLLPKYRGLNTHQRALDDKEKKHGATVHFVDKTLDGGKIIKQISVIIDVDDNAKTLQKKVLQQEHLLYPSVLADFAIAKNKKLTSKNAH